MKLLLAVSGNFKSKQQKCFDSWNYSMEIIQSETKETISGIEPGVRTELNVADSERIKQMLLKY